MDENELINWYSIPAERIVISLKRPDEGGAYAAAFNLVFLLSKLGVDVRRDL